MSVGSKIPVVVQWLCVGQHVAGQVKNQWGRFSIPHYFPWEEGRGLLRIIGGHLLQNNRRINRTKYFINEQSLLGHFSFWTSMYSRKNGGTVSLRSTTQVAISLSPAWDASTTSSPYKLWGMFSKKKYKSSRSKNIFNHVCPKWSAQHETPILPKKNLKMELVILD